MFHFTWLRYVNVTLRIISCIMCNAIQHFALVFNACSCSLNARLFCILVSPEISTGQWQLK